MKRFACFLMMMIMLMACCVTAQAAEASVLELQRMEILDDGTLRAVVFADCDDELTPEAFTVLLDDKNVPLQAVSGYQAEKMGTTWLFVADLARNSKHVDPMKELITALVMNMGEQDNAAIITADLLLNEVKLTSDKTALVSEVEKLESSVQQTINNTQIASAFMLCDTLAETKPRVNVMIITNGQTVNEKGKTWEELNALAEKTDACIYSIVMMPKDGQTKKANNYRDLALKCSTGFGKIFEYKAYDNINTALLDVVGHEARFRVLTLPVQDFDWSEMVLSLKTGDKVLSAKMQLTAQQVQQLQDLRKETAKLTAEPTAEPTATPAPTPVPTKKPILTVVWEFATENALLLLAGAVLIVLIVVLLVVKTPKAKPETKPEQGTEIIDDDSGHPVEDGVYVRLVTLDAADAQCYEFFVEKELIIGRARSVSQLAIADRKISAQHAKISFHNGRLYIEDLKSTNGTKINGMAINSMVPLQQQDIITMGLTKLRISWK